MCRVDEEYVQESCEVVMDARLLGVVGWVGSDGGGMASNGKWHSTAGRKT